MSADKRSVSTDALETLGMIIDNTQKRDAIHIAVEPVVAGEDLKPGDHVNITDGVAYLSTSYNAPLGIVDPFLTTAVKRGERFWFLMYPRQVRSLRHVWSHPDFPDDEVGKVVEVPILIPPETIRLKSSEDWMVKAAASEGLTYSDLMEGAKEYLKFGTCIHLTHDVNYEFSMTDFWSHYEKLTGESLPDHFDDYIFICSC